MITYQLTSTVIGLVIAGSILFLVRRDHMHGPYALWWLGMALLALLLGIFPQWFDKLAGFFGVRYPPALALVMGLALMLIKMVTMDVERSRQERKIRRLAQRLAMLEARALAAKSDEATPTDPDDSPFR
ncbi:MAG: DUF2304 domain-containing protein [Gammaproteobacteria bacterium]|nr:DUF2304 domain-containing protein [Gammaproteobacteria bacterium]MCP5424050.1 DUF2304 domain-containing protein [Gammaproteobacteria bacterium]